MLPVVAGRAETTRQILIYSVLLVPISVLPWALGFAGTIYAATAIVCGAILIVLAVQLSRSAEADRRAAHRLFAFSILYLFVLFAALLPGHGGNRWLSMFSLRTAPTPPDRSKPHRDRMLYDSRACLRRSGQTRLSQYAVHRTCRCPHWCRNVAGVLIGRAKPEGDGKRCDHSRDDNRQHDAEDKSGPCF